MRDWLAERADASPGKTAVITGDEYISYRQLNHRVARMASQLAAIGVGPGKHVAVLMPNRVEYVCLIHALARLNAVLVPVNTRLTAPEIGWQLEDAACEFVICSSETEAQAAPHAGPGRAVWSVDRPERDGVGDLPDASTDDSQAWSGASLNLDAVQGIIYTSGTTGRPKGAMLTYANHFWNATASSYRLGIQPEDRWLLTMPLYHVGGQAIVLRSCLYGTAVVLHDGFDPDAVSDALHRDGVTLVSLVPTMLRRLLDTRNDGNFGPTLRCVLLGGSAAPADLVERSIALNVPVALTYGLTEAASQVATAPVTDVRGKPHSVGKPLMFKRVEIVGDDGEALPHGEIGEIVVSGPGVTQGYYRNPKATQEALRDGWLHTGDMGYRDEDGDLWVVQRRTDLIVSGGENVYPAEVEAVLLGHPGVREVCVVGVDDAQWGQRVAAVVVSDQPGLAEDDLITFCREYLAGFKLPRTVAFVHALPRTASGKLRRDRVAKLVRSRSVAT